MSLLKKIGAGFKKLAPVISQVGGFIPGVGPAVAAAAGVVANRQASKAASRAMIAAPGVGFNGGGTMSLSALPTLGRMLPGIGSMLGAGTIARGVMVGGRSIARSAVSYCRKHPAWCAAIGGTAAIEAMIRSGQLPPVKHRRARGLSASDLKSFRRVANLMKRHYTTAQRVPCKVKRASCR